MDEPEEIYMFADLEKTLCEGLNNLRFDRTIENNPVDIDVSCLENIKDLSKIHGPAVRSKLYNFFCSVRRTTVTMVPFVLQWSVQSLQGHQGVSE